MDEVRKIPQAQMSASFHQARKVVARGLGDFMQLFELMADWSVKCGSGGVCQPARFGDCCGGWWGDGLIGFPVEAGKFGWD